MARPAACRYWGPPRKRMRRPFWRSTAPGDICFAPITRAAMSRCIRSRRTAPLVPHTAATQNNVWEPPKNNPGPNVILQYRFDSQTGRMSPNTPHRVEQRDLIGPRHYIHHPSLDAVYFSNEQGCSVTAYRIDGANGTLSSMQTTSTLPAGHSERTTCSQIHLTPSARLLYVGNRAVNGSSIAAFAVDPETGHLTAAGHTPTEAVPSAFCLDPAGDFLFAAGTASGRLASYRINQQSGALTPLALEEVGHRPAAVPRPLRRQRLSAVRSTNAEVGRCDTLELSESRIGPTVPF